jgi:quercetin dioxygenase-like cupin family protein
MSNLVIKDSAEKLDRLVDLISGLPQVECPLKEIFAPGVYYREIVMPADSVIVGHEHKTRHLNIVLSGKAEVVMDGSRILVQAGDVFVSEIGVRKALHILEETRWATIHPTEETEPAKLEELLINKRQIALKPSNPVGALL